MTFVVFGGTRTGSSLLVDTLRTHPQVQCDVNRGEILHGNHWRRGAKRLLRYPMHRFPEPYLFWAAHRRTKQVYGFKLLTHQIAAPGRLITNLYRSGWLVIHIQRRRLCDLALSQQVAQLTNHYGPYMPTKQPDPTLIAVTPDSFIQQMQHCTDTMRGELQTLAGIPRLRVIYEADLCNQVETNRTCSAIFTTLGIEQRPVTTSRTRSWNRQYSELIPTFDELQALMQMEKSLELQAVWDRFFMED